MVSPILTSEDAQRPVDFRRARSGARDARRARPDARFRGQGGRRHRHARHPRRAGRGQGRARQPGARRSRRSPTRDGAPLPFTLGEAVEGKGAPLTVASSGDGPAAPIVIAYTAPEAEALQWLAPEQTAGGEHPYLLSQGQPTLNRTWIPTQDSPGIRQTWEARIVAPKPLTVVMSGLRGGEPEDAGRRHARVPLRDGQAGRAVPDRHRRGRPRVPRARPALGRVDRAVDARRRRGRAGRHREDDRRRRGALRPLPLGPLRHDRAAAERSPTAAWRTR